MRLAAAFRAGFGCNHHGGAPALAPHLVSACWGEQPTWLVTRTVGQSYAGLMGQSPLTAVVSRAARMFQSAAWARSSELRDEEVARALLELGVTDDPVEVRREAGRLALTDQYTRRGVGLLVVLLTLLYLSPALVITTAFHGQAEAIDPSDLDLPSTELTRAFIRMAALESASAALAFMIVLLLVAVIAWHLTVQLIALLSNNRIGSRSRAIERLLRAIESVGLRERGTNLLDLDKRYAAAEAALLTMRPSGRTNVLRAHHRGWIDQEARNVGALEFDHAEADKLDGVSLVLLYGRDSGGTFLPRSLDWQRHHSVLTVALCRVLYDNWPANEPPHQVLQRTESGQSRGRHVGPHASRERPPWPSHSSHL